MSISKSHIFGRQKFNLDDPDGLQVYWHDNREELKSYLIGVQRKRFVLIWKEILYNRKVDMLKISVKMELEYYIQVLGTILKPVADSLLSNEWVLKQENAAVHTSQHMLEFLDVHEMDFIDWLAKSTDMNIIKNVQSCPVREVYKNRRHSETWWIHKTLSWTLGTILIQDTFKYCINLFSFGYFQKFKTEAEWNHSSCYHYCLYLWQILLSQELNFVVSVSYATFHWVQKKFAWKLKSYFFPLRVCQYQWKRR